MQILILILLIRRLICCPLPQLKGGNGVHASVISGVVNVNVNSMGMNFVNPCKNIKVNNLNEHAAYAYESSL